MLISCFDKRSVCTSVSLNFLAQPFIRLASHLAVVLLRTRGVAVLNVKMFVEWFSIKWHAAIRWPSNWPILHKLLCIREHL